MSLERLFMLPFLLHFALVMVLYVWLTVLRQTAIRSGEVKPVEFVNAGADPSRSKRVARNLSNQFELPVYGLFAALFLYFSHRVGMLDVVAACCFWRGGSFTRRFRP
jgi:hypothetical protein